MQIHTIDLQFQQTPELIAVFVIESAGELALIETGPASSLETLRAGLRARGFDERAIRKVFVTHVHLDHAGAAGWWAQQGAQIYCHARAERHLADPAKLISGAREIYGDRTDALWGDTLPAPTERLTVLPDGGRVRVGEIEIEAWETPGHARHHHAYVIGTECFTGDVAGMRLPGSEYLSVTAAPPQFEPPAYTASLDRLAAANFTRLHLTHFGAITDVSSHLARYRQRVLEVHEAVRADVAAGCDAEEIRIRYAAREHATATTQGVGEADWRRVDMCNSTSMCADGVRMAVEKAAE